MTIRKINLLDDDELRKRIDALYEIQPQITIAKWSLEIAKRSIRIFVDIIVDQQKAFNALSGDVLSEQAIADFEYFASLPTEEVGIVISGMISLLQDTDEKYDSLKEQNFIQRMFKTVLGKNKATKQEIRDNYDRLTVYVSKSIEILLKRQCVDEKVIQILGSEIISLCKGHVRLTAQVEALTHRVDNLTNSLVLVTASGSSPKVTSVKAIADEGALKIYKEAETLFLSGKLIDAFQQFKAASENDVARAYYYLGEYYANGYGHIKPNASSALESWRKGMELGDPLSTYNYGLLQYDGNRIQAEKWMRNHIHPVLVLMKDDDPAALYLYGWHLITENIGDSDALTDALGYFQKCAELGYWPGGFMFYQYTEDFRKTGVELPNYLSLFERVEWFGTQLMAGMAKMMLSPIDLNASAKHFQKALWLRDDIPEPAGYLAFLLNTGLIQESIGDGISAGNIQMYYAAGIKSQEPIALYQIGILYYYGIEDGRGLDYQKAYEHLEKSYKYSKQGVTAGLLGYMNLVGEGVHPDMNAAIHYLTAGYHMGDPNAASLLALCYKEGYGVEKDPGKHDALMAQVKQLPIPDSFDLTQKFIKAKLDELMEEWK